MDRNYDNIIKSVNHLKTLHETFLNKNNYSNEDDYNTYIENSNKISKILSMPNVELYKQLYDEKSRQMILADVIEYIFISRGIFFLSEKAGNKEKKKRKRELFIEIILNFVNLLMTYESMTIDDKLRKSFLQSLAKKIPEIGKESLYNELLNYTEKVGLTKKDLKNESKEDYFNKYFDKLLPKTAGGLWHELLVFIFLLKQNLGYIIPLLLNQKFYSALDNIVPPDYLLITSDSKIYGIEVGIKKEIQSGTFSLQTNIPTATIDTINSRNSDRCPICKKWILFCPQVIKNYSNMEIKIPKTEIKCLDSCTIYSKKEIVEGKCPYAKYSRNKTKSIKHKFADNLHYHYNCILKNLSDQEKKTLIKQEDKTAIKTHHPHYSGLEPLFKRNK